MVTVEADVVRVESRLAAGAIGLPYVRVWRARRLGVCPGSADRWPDRSAAAEAGTLSVLRGDARVVAGDHVAA